MMDIEIGKELANTIFWVVIPSVCIVIAAQVYMMERMRSKF